MMTRRQRIRSWLFLHLLQALTWSLGPRPVPRFEAIRQRVNILELIGRDVKLIQHPSLPDRWRGLCPFHGGGDAPTFVVHTRVKLFNCFEPDCSAGGDVVEYVRRRDGITYAEAVVRLEEAAA